MNSDLVLEANSVLNYPLAMRFLPELHRQKNNEFIGSLGSDEINPCETCLNCFYPRCLHGECQELLKNGYGRGLRELEVLNRECRYLLFLYLNEDNTSNIENDDVFVQRVVDNLSRVKQS